MFDNTDLIDRYLTGDLGEDEKKELERLLFDDSDSLESKKLREEMELQKEIILAIQSRGLRECLQEKEQQKLYNQPKTFEFCLFVLALFADEIVEIVN